MKLDLKEVKSIVKNALWEDVGDGDITTVNLIPPTHRASARIVAKDSGVISGLSVARQVFKQLDKNCVWRSKFSDGDKVKSGRTVATLTGLARAILTGERIALNFLSRLSGISTLTARFFKKISKTKIKIYDTRKTTPGLRYLERYAVVCGGGYSHRYSLDEMVLVKENHIKVCRKGRIPLAQALEALDGKIPRGMLIEVEAQNIREVEFALKTDADIIMLDNLDMKTLKRAIRQIKKSRKDVEIEISGGIKLKNIEKIARLDIQRISIGAITHSALPLDFSLDIV